MTGLASVAAKSTLLHRNLHEKPYVIARASGNWIWLKNGWKVFDGSGGAAVSCLGHGNRQVYDAIDRQREICSSCCTLSFGTDIADQLADFLMDSTGDRMARACIYSSGSEAVEAAMKLAVQYHREVFPAQNSRTKFIARGQSYHGATFGALSLGGHWARRELYKALLMNNVHHIAPCNPYHDRRDDETDADYVDRLVKELDDKFQELGPATVLAFVAEPTVGASLGCVAAVPGYLKAMKEVCDKYGALFILDEVMCGMGRTGTLHAWEQEGVVPDIQTVAKGLGGGFAPVSAILIGPRVAKALADGTGEFKHGQTYQNHPIGCAAALQVQRIIQNNGLLENVREKGKLLLSSLKERLANHPNIEFVQDKTTKETFDPVDSVALGLHRKALEPPYSIHLYPGTGTKDGKSGDHVIISPAFNITDDDVKYIVQHTADAIEDFFDQLNKKKQAKQSSKL